MTHEEWQAKVLADLEAERTAALARVDVLQYPCAIVLWVDPKDTLFSTTSPRLGGVFGPVDIADRQAMLAWVAKGYLPGKPVEVEPLRPKPSFGKLFRMPGKAEADPCEVFDRLTTDE